jgi:chemotaxis protein MotB
MARKKKIPERENHERWLISYADFITLLFAFFVVLFASSQTDKGRAQQVSNAVTKALEGEHVSAMIAAVLGGTADQSGPGSAMMRGPGGANKTVQEIPPDPHALKLAELVPSLEVLTRELHQEIEEGRIQISMQPRGLVVSFAQAALFPSGEDVISPDAYGGLEKVARAIAKLPNPVRLEGHTDAVPIHTPRFRSNWDLSAARAIALMQILTGRFDVPRERLSIAGYADTAPIASNDSEAGRARNRRVDIVVLNEQGLLGEPLKAPAQTPPQIPSQTAAEPPLDSAPPAPAPAPRVSSKAPAGQR